MQFLRSVLGTGGAAKDGFPYEWKGQAFESCWGSWSHQRATNKEDGSEVSVFSITGANATDAKLAPARNSAKRLRTLRHPNVISFLNSVEVEKDDGGVVKPTLHIITEPVTPLSEKLEELNLKGAQRDEYISWGLHQVAKAVSFLNNDCKLVHGNVCMASVVVTASLDWKLHFFDVLSEFDGGKPDAPDGPMLANEWLVGTQYKPMEVAKGDWATVRKGPPHAIDSWGLGCLIQELFSGKPLSRTEELRNTAPIPKSLLPDYQRLLGSIPSRRMNPSKLIDNSEFFQNKLVETFQFMEVLTIKDSVEKDSFCRKLPHLVEQLPRPVVLKKLLPLLASALEFGSAPAPALNVLLKIGAWLPPDDFNAKVLPTLVKLFASSDRGIRVALLQHIDSFGTALAPNVVDDQVFTHLSTGFSDSSAFLRELTLKSCLVLAPKMSQRTLGGPLLKHLSKLQVDEEPAIRTNTTILLGNIARHLNDATRKRVLINAFTVRALRDTFAPARSAGIMALMATREFYDTVEIATRILPLLVALTVDSDGDVRVKAVEASKAFLQSVEDHFALSMSTSGLSAVGDGYSTANGSVAAAPSSASQSSSASSSGLLGWAVSSITGAPSAQPAAPSPAAPASAVTAPTSAAAAAAAAPTAASSSSLGVAAAGKPAAKPIAAAAAPAAAYASAAVAEEEEEVQAEEEEADGWDDLDDVSSPQASAALSRIQAAQQRPVVSSAAPTAASRIMSSTAAATRASSAARPAATGAVTAPSSGPAVREATAAVAPSGGAGSSSSSSGGGGIARSKPAGAAAVAASDGAGRGMNLRGGTPSETAARSSGSNDNDDDPWASIAAPAPAPSTATSSRVLGATSLSGGAAAAGRAAGRGSLGRGSAGRGAAAGAAPAATRATPATGHVKLPAGAAGDLSLESMLGNSMGPLPGKGSGRGSAPKLGAQRLGGR